ncbi:TPA: branched-chain amino acid ABC transporter permease, partial [Campylobacter coli]|nr:branched-chain amino acid ABC transporter permease [Campylobacter coli]
MVKIKISALVYIVLAIAFIMLAPQFFDGYGIGILNQIAIYITLAVSYNLINGVTGQFSLEPNGFIAVGAYAAALVLLSSEQKLDLFSLEDPNPIILALHTNSFILALLVAG